MQSKLALRPNAQENQKQTENYKILRKLATKLIGAVNFLSPVIPVTALF